MEPGRRPAWVVPLAVGLFFASGACGLVYEVVWTRMLVGVFGHTVHAASTVLAAYMAGLGLGSWAFGRLADRRPGRLRLYGWLELGVGLSAALVPLGLMGIEAVYVAAGRAVGDSLVGLTPLRFSLAFLLVLGPACLMGGSLPVLSRFLVASTEKAGRRVGLLYALNTAGAVAGTLLAGFWAMGAFGMRVTQFLAVGLNLAIGLTALLAARRLGPVGEPAPTPPVAASPSPASGAAPAGLRRLSLTVLGVSGFTALAYEVIYFRVLVLVMGTTVYAFSAMLAVFLGGLALGSALASVWADRTSRPFLSLGLVQVLIAAAVLLSVGLFGELPWAFLALLPEGPPTWARATLVEAAVSCLLLLPPALLLGAVFPLATRIEVRGREGLGRGVGRLYLANTLGAIGGSVAAGFLLVPLLGLRASALSLLGLNALAGIALWLAAPGGGRHRRVVWAALAVLGLGLGMWTAPSWDRAAMTSGVYLYCKFDASAAGDRAALRAQLERRLAQTELLYYREGLGATVSVRRTRDALGGALLAIQVDGRTVATSDYNDMRLQRSIGHLPMLLHADPREVLVIGLGAGVTAGACAIHPGARIEVVELEAAVVEGARRFGAHNHGVVDRPGVELRVNDGRNHLLMSGRSYDVITADPIHPFAAGSSSLYTVEFYELCRAALRPGGVMCQWLPLYELGQQDVAMLLASFQSVFPHTTVWLTGTDVGLIGAREPLRVEPARLRARLADPAVRADLEALHLAEPHALLSRLFLDQAAVASLARGARLNTDAHLALEYTAPRSMYSLEAVEDNLAWMFAARTTTEALARALSGGSEELDPGLLARHVRARDEVVQALTRGRDDPRVQLGHLESAVAACPEDRDAARHLAVLLQRRGNARLGAGELAAARADYARALGLAPGEAGLHYSFARAEAREGRAEEALTSLERALALDPDHLLAGMFLGEQLKRLGREVEAVAAFERLVARHPDFRLARSNLGALLARQGRLEEAARELRRALELEPGSPEDRANLARVEEALEARR